MDIYSISKSALLAAAVVASPAVIAQNTTANDHGTKALSQGKNVVTSQTSGFNSDTDQAGTLVQIVSFAPDSVTLNDNASQRLDNLVQALEKDRPTRVTVKLEQRDAAVSNASDEAAGALPNGGSSVDENLADSSGANQSVGTPSADYQSRAQASAMLNQEMQASAELLSEHRAERVKQYLEDRGVQVAQFDVTGSAYQANSSQQTAQSQQAALQEVLIVITADRQRNGLSAR